MDRNKPLYLCLRSPSAEKKKNCLIKSLCAFYTTRHRLTHMKQTNKKSEPTFLPVANEDTEKEQGLQENLI